MKIIDLKVMRGPNIWSNYRQRVVIMTLDLQEMEKRPTHRIEGFNERIRETLPSLYSHRCSEGNKGGFFQRVEQGTWMGHVIEHIALELQSLAGMFVGYGRTRSTDREGVYHVVFAYRVAGAGIYAAKAAVQVADALARSLPCEIDGHVKELKKLRAQHASTSHTDPVTAEAEDQDIPFHFVNDALLLLGHGLNQSRIRGNLTSVANNIALEAAGNRHLTNAVLRNAMFSVPTGAEVSNREELSAFAAQSNPFLIKPLMGSHGRRIAVPFSSAEDAYPFLEHTLLNYRYAYAESFIEGDLFRVLMIGRKPAGIIRVPRIRIVADGKTRLSSLVEQHSGDRITGLGSGYDPDLVLPKNKTFWIDGEPETCDTAIHNDTAFLLERAAATLDLDCCLVDMIGGDPARSSDGVHHAIVAVDAQPALSEFTDPVKGYGQNVVRSLFKQLFRNRRGGKIPVIAIRGNGESPGIASVISDVCIAAGKNPGYATSGGLRICGHTLSEEDCTDRVSVRGLLFDPCIDTAIVECSTQVILGSGLPFDSSDVSIITGNRARKTSRNREHSVCEKQCDMVVGRTTARNGFIILNADNDCDELARDLYGTIAIYSAGPEKDTVLEHCSDGGIGAVVENGTVILLRGKWRTPVLLPAAVQKADASFLKSLLPAVLAVFVLDVPPHVITGRIATLNTETHQAAFSN